MEKHSNIGQFLFDKIINVKRLEMYSQYGMVIDDQTLKG